VEKDAVAKRQAEKAAALANTKDKDAPSGRKSWRLSKALSGPGTKETPPERPLSADRVATLPSLEAIGNRRMSSAMKVQQWQQAQVQSPESPAESSSWRPNRESRGYISDGAVPFPSPSQSRSPNPRRKSRTMGLGARDPPS